MSQQAKGSPFHLVREGRTQILFDSHFHDWPQDMGIGNVERIVEKSHIDPNRGGRQGLRVFCPDGRGAHRFVIRHYAHGGLLRRIMGDRFLLGSRPFREMTLTDEVRRRGIPTLRVVAAIRYRDPWPFYRGDLITTEIPSSKDMVCFLLCRPPIPSREETALRHEVVRQAGRAVRVMHSQGVCHGDLNLKNLLVQTGPQGPQVYVIDFDRSRILKRLSLRRRMKNLLRLNRSVEKWKAKGARISYTDKARFFQAYAESNSDIVHSMKRHLKKHRIHARWYRMGWFTDRLLNPSNH